ncbi:MAG: glycosyltransferase family 87 protein [Gordonia sp. (in: high G+C Gram-positive bacteria)]
MSVLDRTLFPTVSKQQILSRILWPLSIALIFQRSVILAVNGSRTDDFTPVYNASLHFLNRIAIYTESYDTVDPHYLYPPSGTLLMAPLAILDPLYSRWTFIAVSVIALVLSAYLLTRLFGFEGRSWVMPAVVFFMFSTESVANTLIFTNFNAFVLLGLVLFLMLLKSRHDYWAGVSIGLTIAVKPVLAPLLLLPLLNRQWRTLVTGIGIPVVLNILAWPLVRDPMSFVTRTLPYLAETRNYYNSSIGGNGAYFGVDGWLIQLLRIVFLAMAVFALWFLYRYYRTTDELLWLSTSSGVLLLTTFLVGSLGQGYYSMLIFPLLMTVFQAGSTMRNWPAWLGVYGCMSFDMFSSKRWEPFGRYLDYNRVTLGWSLILIAIFCVLLFRWLDIRAAHKNGVIDDDAPERRATPPAATVEA